MSIKSYWRLTESQGLNPFEFDQQFEYYIVYIHDIILDSGWQFNKVIPVINY